MSGFAKGLCLAAIQIAIVLSLAGKLLYDRATRPRVWVQAEGYDPELMIRGRYLAERLRFSAEGFKYVEPVKPNIGGWYLNQRWAYLEVRGGQLIGEMQGAGPGEWVYLEKNGDGTLMAVSQEPVLVFVPERAAIPTYWQWARGAKTKNGQEVWVEVTIPTKGPPRPIRIGVMKNGVISPVEFR